jgi:hypothetical protein
MHVRGLRMIMQAVALAVGVASILAGCGSGDGASTDAVAGTYTDSAYGFSFEYPTDWRVVASGGAGITSGAAPTEVVTVGDPNGARVGDTGIDMLMIRVYELPGVVDDASLPQVLPDLERLVADFQSQDPSFKVEAPLAQTNVGGIPGYQATGTFDWDANTPVKTTFYFLFAGNIQYQLTMQASAKTWEENQAVFAAFLESFKLGETTK